MILAVARGGHDHTPHRSDCSRTPYDGPPCAACRLRRGARGGMGRGSREDQLTLQRRMPLRFASIEGLKPAPATRA
jgi:hypothetical protein